MATYQAGFNSKVRVNGGVYVAQTWNCAGVNAEQDVTNTEGIPGNPALPGNNGLGINTAYASFIPAISRFQATVTNATFDLTDNPFSPPESIYQGRFIALYIYPNLVISPWRSPSFLINNASQQGDVRTLQPVSFSGVGDGGVQLPGNPSQP